MRKLHILFATLCLVLAGACSSDDILEQTPGTPETPETPDAPQVKGQRITIRASVDDAMGTKAGVDEGASYDNDAGETFYWNNNDQIKLLFVQVVNEKEYFDYSNPIPTALFTAEDAKGEAADFTGYIPDGLENGIYNVYVCSPRILQSFNNGSNKYENVIFSSLQRHQTQIGRSSEQLYTDGNMELWGKAVKGVEIVDGKLKGGTPELSFEMAQLNAMLRFTIENTMNQAMTVKEIRIAANGENGSEIKSFFNHSADLEYSPNITGWSSFSNSSWSTMSLTIDPNEGEATIATGDTFDAYMCLLPTNRLREKQTFVVEVYLQDADGMPYLRQGTITKGIEAFDFLYSAGLEGGMRYYFQIALNDANTVLNTYAIGDLYPKVGVPEGIVFEVNENGTVGKMISLDETETTWGVVGETGATDMMDGEANTNIIMGLIEADKEELTGKYPAFEWCVDKGYGWYLPAVNEMQGVATVKETLNPILQSAAGTPLSAVSYWLSMANYNSLEGAVVEDESNAVVCNFYMGGMCLFYPRSDSYFVRAMKKFDITK